MSRPDQENLDTLLKHYKNVGFGKTLIEHIIHDGWLVAWEEVKTTRGHRAPLKKVIKEKEEEEEI